MIYFKSCLRCEGDVHLDTDAWGAYMKCLQCGQVWDFRRSEERAGLKEELAELAAQPAVELEPELEPAYDLPEAV